jgi:hypothetical protein
VNHFVTSTVRPPSRPLEFLDAGILDEGCGAENRFCTDYAELSLVSSLEQC